MNIQYYKIEHTEMAIHGDIAVLLEAVSMVLGIIITFFLLFILINGIIYLLTKFLKIKCENNTMMLIALILNLAITNFMFDSSIKNVNKHPYLVIWYENPTQKIEIQKSALIDNLCFKIENGQLNASNPLSMRLNLYRKAIKITKDEEEKIHKAEKYYRDKVKEERKEKYTDRLEIID